MSLIKCPECGKEISTAAASCPHCGYPLAKEKDNGQAKDYPAPKPNDWVKEWSKKAIIGKVVLGVLTALSAIPLALGLAFNNLVSFIIGLSFCVLFFLFFFASLIAVHPRTRVVDGYTILVYSGLFKNYFVIEGEVQGSGFTARYFNGNLPNGKPVRAGISIWDGASKIDVGEEKTF